AADDPKEIAQRIRGGAAAPLPEGVPPALARVVARCLAKEPQDRFPDARALASALEDALAPLSRLPVPVLVSRALGAAKLGGALPAPPGATAREPRTKPAAIDVARAARDLSVVLALLVLGGVGLRWIDDPDASEGEGVAESGPSPQPGNRDRGMVRVVAA